MSSSILAAPIRTRSAPSLHHRVLIGAGIGGAIVVLLLAAGANYLLGRDINRQGDVRIADAAGRALIVVNDALVDRARQAKVLAMSPGIVAAAREGGTRAATLGIVNSQIAEMEQRFEQDRSLLASPATRIFLRELLPELEVAEVLLTDANGYNAITTQRTSDFVQRDEAWWQSAWAAGLSSADASFDSSAHQTTVSLAAVVRDGGTKLGVLKLAFSASPLVRSLQAAGAGVRVDVLDSASHILLSTDSSMIGRLLSGMPDARTDSGRLLSVRSDTVSERAVALPTNSGKWRIVAHLPEQAIATSFRTARLAIVGGAAALLVVLALLMVGLSRFLERRISAPSRLLAEAAEAVAAGDFSLELNTSSSDDELGRLSRAVGAMILELRRLAQAIAGSAYETSAMSIEITAGSEEMAATAGEIARTASDLSEQATGMAETIGALAGSASALRSLAATLDAGAREGVARNTALLTLALENRTGLDATQASLVELSGDVNASASAILALQTASEEIRSFVTLVRQLARQSKLLALNAAMEAARAGVQGHGFAVVATEVRRLAAMSSDAADKTEAIVKVVLTGITDSHESANRAVAAAELVHRSTTLATESFAQVERAVVDSEAWTATIAGASASTNSLVAEITDRLDTLNNGTESFAAAMQQVAASSQEQSASTEEIAAAASALGAAAERLSKLVGGLKVEAQEPPAAKEPPAAAKPTWSPAGRSRASVPSVVRPA